MEIRYEHKDAQGGEAPEDMTMEPRWIDLTPEALADEHLCCIIRKKKPHPGVETKRA